MCSVMFVFDKNLSITLGFWRVSLGTKLKLLVNLINKLVNVHFFFQYVVATVE